MMQTFQMPYQGPVFGPLPPGYFPAGCKPLDPLPWRGKWQKSSTKFTLMEGGAHGGESTIAGLLLTLGTPAAVVIAVVAGFCLAKLQPTSQKRHPIESDQDPGTRMVRVRRSASDNECPICMDPAKFAVETNCGHMYCWLTPQLGLLMGCLTCEFLTLYGQLQDLPTILRHIWAELFTWRGVEMISRFRVLICIVTAIIYAIMPIDLIPEAFVGLLGLIDDVIVIAFLLIQVSVVYRTVVANRDW
ncbi:E3 ubiquitin-protein ligase RNF170-like [Penaeus chinensis]|uniref:E3 ubiquitin-protein ligase RNF170-like n=1 Tax=Penaeus chinensis TaxID=139456 RepID=UPI001FB768B6|nr:E3 ubiquitin-protein ligase RNF170-like [Penaeus chinensis]